MKNWSIRTKIIILSLLPTLVMALLLSSYFSISQFVRIQSDLNNQGLSIIRQLAPGVKYGLLTSNTQILQGLATAAIENPNIASISIFNKSGRLIAYSGPDNLMPKDLSASVKKHTKTGKYLKFTEPLSIQQITLRDYKLPNIKSEQVAGATIGWITAVITANTAKLALLQTLFVIFIIILLSLIICGFIIWLLSLSISKPIMNILRGVINLEQGNYDSKIKPVNSKEYNRITDGMNKLGEQLKQAQVDFQQNLELQTKDLRQNLEEIEIQNIELNIALKNAEKINRGKSEFIASLSHEVRTPMSSIIGFTNLLLESNLNQFQIDYLNTIKKSANTLLAILNDILDFSKIEAGKFKLDVVPVDICELIEEILQTQAPQAQPKHLELIALIEPEVPQKLLGDPLRIKQILTNLVFNAIKFTNDGSVSVKASLEKVKNKSVTLKINVIDTGIGLSEKAQTNLFKAFTQAEISTARIYGGTGLGLVISKQLIEQMGGSIEVHSKSGIGTSINFTLELASFDNIHAQMPLKTVSPLAEKIIIFESHTLSRKALKLALQPKVKVIESCDTLEKLMSSLEKNQDYSCIIISVNEDEFTRSKTLKCIQTFKQKYNIPIIATLNSLNESLIEDVISAGAKSCISKPISRKKLLQVIALSLNTKNDQHKKPPMIHHAKNKRAALDVLIADDNAANLKLLASLLRMNNVNINTATDGDKAWQLCQQKPFNLIILDLQMPILDGLATAKLIRTQPNPNQYTSIIAVSAYITEDEKAQLLQTGVNEFVLKPIEPKQLKTLLNKWCSNTFVTANNIIDLTQATKLAGGKEDIAKDILKSFLNELPNYEKEADVLFKKNSWGELEKIIHKVHGAASFCAAIDLKASSETYEQALRNNDADDINKLHERFTQSIKAVYQFVADNNI